MKISNSDQHPLDAAVDIDAREAQILGSPQRIAPLAPEELDEEARALVISIRASVGANPNESIPPVFATMLKHPGLYRCTMDIGIQLLGKGLLSPRERELAVLRVAWLCRAPYEWGQHVEIAKRYAITAEEIERVTRGSTAAGWTEHEAAIIRGVEELLGDQMISDETWDVLARTWDERQLMEFPTLVGQYVSVAYSQNALRIRLNTGNRGLRHR